MSVSARPANDLPVAAGWGLVDMRAGAPVRAGTFVYDGPDTSTGWHSHDMHQIEYAFVGTAEVETASTHHLLPPQQAVWIPAGLTHRTTLKRVRSIAVFLDPVMVQGADDRVRVLAATPLLREMIVFAARWPIGRPSSDETSDLYFAALAALVREWLEHEAPLSLPTSTDPTVRTVMEYTGAHLDAVTMSQVCAYAAISERSLRRKFAAAAGMTWREYLLQSRLLRAMALLAEPGRTVLDVSTAVGFESVSAFTRAFGRLTGETPTAYRRRATATMAAPEGDVERTRVTART